MKLIKIINVIILFTASFLIAQNNLSKNPNVYVDNFGVMHWDGTNDEVALFGVNYTTPFAYSYRAHKKLNLSLKQAIDLDVAQLVRLGFDAFRVHMWDREISDRDGNVLNNEHLELFDYLLSKLSDNGIKTILTPIAWWGTGWPEPDIETLGFSQIYSKIDLVTNKKAREAQRNYLTQIMNHVNPYTKYSYKNDPSIIAIEIINEPRHPDEPSLVTEYINEMYDVIRGTGYTKPIFYNISENWNDAQANAVTNSKIQGVTFQWYPTGLVHNKILDGNYLINVNKYNIPHQNVFGFDKKVKMVYEFDAADIAGSYMYPAMARSFREAGMQFAAMFSYDPTQIAWSNTEYPTHFVNLLYTPSKAISLMIAGKVFHKTPLRKSYGNYPLNNNFESFRVSYEENLSEMNSDKEFYYSNNTNTNPVKPEMLTNIAGVGNSPIIKYDGTGAYFLDKLENGIWRLEVYPDCIWLNDPFEQTSLTKEAARLFWNKRNITINLVDLGEGFTVKKLNGMESKKISVNKNELNIDPGIYLLVSNSADHKKIKKYSSGVEHFLNNIYLPDRDSKNIYVVNQSNQYLRVESSKHFKFQIASTEIIKSAYLFIKRIGWRGFSKYELKNNGGFEYVPLDSTIKLDAGNFEYCVTVETENQVLTFPEKINKRPWDWDFSIKHLWNGVIINQSKPIVIFDAARDHKDLVFPQFTDQMRYRNEYHDGSINGINSLHININYKDSTAIPFGFQLNIKKYLNPINSDSLKYSYLVIKARSHNSDNSEIKINFLLTDGRSFSSKVTLIKNLTDIKVPLADFTSAYALILPNSYPRFLPKVWESSERNSFNINDIKKCEFIQIICEPTKLESSIEIESIHLE